MNIFIYKKTGIFIHLHKIMTTCICDFVSTFWFRVLAPLLSETIVQRRFSDSYRVLPQRLRFVSQFCRSKFVYICMYVCYSRRLMNHVAHETPHGSTSVDSSSSAARNDYATIDLDNVQPSVTSSNVAETGDYVTDQTLIDNDLYERPRQHH